MFSVLYFQTGMLVVDGEHFLIEPSNTGFNTNSDLNNQSEQAIPHLLYSLRHSKQNTINKGKEADSPSCAVDSGKLFIKLFLVPLTPRVSY